MSLNDIFISFFNSYTYKTKRVLKKSRTLIEKPEEGLFTGKITRRNLIKAAALAAVGATVAPTLDRIVSPTRAQTAGGDSGNPFGTDTIPISPALIIPDCSDGQYSTTTGKARTSLGTEKENEGLTFATEWDDTYEYVLESQAFFRAKYDSTRFYAIGIWPNKKTIEPGDIINIYFDTENSGGSKPQYNHLGIWIGYDDNRVKSSWFAKGNGERYDFTDMPVDVKWNCGGTNSPYGTSLIFEVNAPLSLINPQNLHMEKMTVMVGNYLSEIGFSNSDIYNPSTWEDGSYLSQSYAIPFGDAYKLLPIALGTALILLKTRKPKVHKAIAEAIHTASNYFK